ncbi:hypothetical protein L0Y40_00080 [Candidatus Wolfebacteria bacterium]|nr:hypothetical protein [Candidatus Wolfebacteria bacterium]
MIVCKKHCVYALVILLLFVISYPLPANSQAPVQTVTVLPAGVDLLWETNAYTPPLYKGKALYPDGGDVHIVAVPDTQFGNPDALFYTWKADGVVLGSLSGLGRRTLDRTGGILGGPVRVAVEIRDSKDGPIRAAGVVQIPTTDPLVLFYEHSPLLGTLFEHTFSEDMVLNRDEITFGAYPFFFSGPDRDAFVYSWRINGTRAGENPQITLHKGEDAGTASVALDVTNPRTILQRARASFTIEF